MGRGVSQVSQTQPDGRRGGHIGPLSHERSQLTRETCTTDVLDSVIGHQKLLLPPHEDRPAICVLHGQMGFLQFMAHVPEGRKACPMNHIFLFRRAPIPGQEAIPATDDLRVEIGGQLWPVVREPSDAQVPAEVGG